MRKRAVNDNRRKWKPSEVDEKVEAAATNIFFLIIAAALAVVALFRVGVF